MIQFKLLSLLLDNGCRLPGQPLKNQKKSRFSLLGNLPVMVNSNSTWMGLEEALLAALVLVVLSGTRGVIGLVASLSI